MQSCRWSYILFVIYVIMAAHGLRPVHATSSVHGKCNTWTSVNSHHPAPSGDKTDYEHVLPSEQSSVCPADIGGKITKVQCLDNNGESFTGSSRNTILKFEVSCHEKNVSVSCKITDPAFGLCPDFSMNLYCDCRWTTAVNTATTNSHTISSTSAIPTQTTNLPTSHSTTPVKAQETTIHTSQILISEVTTTDVTTTSGQSPSTMKSTFSRSLTYTSKMPLQVTHTDFGNPDSTSIQQKYQNTRTTNDETITIGGVTISLWLITVIICAILFTFNAMLTICLYKKAMRSRKKHDMENVIHPLDTV